VWVYPPCVETLHATSLQPFACSLLLLIMPEEIFYVISYDISENKRRTKIHKCLKSYGEWKQFSVFECRLTATQYQKLRHRLDKLIKPAEDSILFYRLGQCCQRHVERIGCAAPRQDDVFLV